jgi:hypothetical protein
MQTKKDSFKESLFFITVSYFTGLMSQLFIFPLIGINISFLDNVGISIYFTIVNFSINFMVRRYYNRLQEVKDAN